MNAAGPSALSRAGGPAFFCGLAGSGMAQPSTVSGSGTSRNGANRPAGLRVHRSVIRVRWRKPGIPPMNWPKADGAAKEAALSEMIATDGRSDQRSWNEPSQGPAPRARPALAAERGNTREPSANEVDLPGTVSRQGVAPWMRARAPREVGAEQARGRLRAAAEQLGGPPTWLSQAKRLTGSSQLVIGTINLARRSER
jgi:hypothetical protein